VSGPVWKENQAEEAGDGEEGKRCSHGGDMNAAL
jgi:hypothetical protein